MFRQIVKAIIPRSLFRKIEPYGHLAEAFLANLLNGFPARGMKIIGVTGTDGKTTTCMLIYTMLNDAGIKTGVATTVGYGVPGQWRPNHINTTVPPFELMRRIKWLKSRGVDWLVLETTSHAIAQNRVYGVPYSLAVFTNLAHEHLDYHGTFENYRAAKVKLFRLVNRNRHGLRSGIINADDANAGYFARAISRPLLFGLKHGELKANKIKTTADGSSFSAEYRDRNLNIKLNLPGEFNVYNALAAIGAGIALGLSNQQIESGIAALHEVEGRMDRIREGQKFEVIVDFAHTPQGFERVLSGLRQTTNGRLIVLFGSPGQRDEAKRPMQGEIAGRWADLVILTEDDARDSNIGQINQEIAAGAKQAGKVEGQDLFLIDDRTEAIQFAINQAKPGDVVALLGKGHEKTIKRDHRADPWNESDEARRAIKRRLSRER